MIRLIAAIAVALALTVAACGDDTDEVATTTTQPETTTTTLSPEDAFIADLERQLTIEGPSGFGEEALGFLTGVCNDLDKFSEFEGDAPNASPQSDAMVGDFAITTTLAIVIDEERGWPPEVGAVLLRAMAEHLCPEYASDVDDLLDTRGL